MYLYGGPNPDLVPCGGDTPSDWFVELHYARVCCLTYSKPFQDLGLCSRPSDGAINVLVVYPMEKIGNQERASGLMLEISSCGVMSWQEIFPG